MGSEINAIAFSFINTVIAICFIISTWSSNASECLKWSLERVGKPSNAKKKKPQSTNQLLKFKSAVCYFSIPNKSTEFKAIVQVMSLNS